MGMFNSTEMMGCLMDESQDRVALVREKLLVDKDAAFRETVDRASRVIKLDEKGQIHPQVDPSRFGAKQKIELLLLGRYLAHAGGLLVKPTVSDVEITEHFGLKIAEVQKRISDLKKSGKIIQTDGREYRLTDGRIGEVLMDLGADRQ
jgi:hypothetical protein